MTDHARDRQAWSLFADLMTYPDQAVAGTARRCAALLRAWAPEAADELDVFAGRAEGESAGRLREIFTTTFDLQPSCYPYLGYQLFGDSYKRAALMVKIQGEYRKHGFVVERELPDHVAVVLRFLTRLEDEALGAALIGECLLPSLEKMAATFAGSENPYGAVVRALVATLAEWSSAPRPETVSPAG